MKSTSEIFTVGHSTHSHENFIKLLRGFEITAVADVRSSPFSRHFPHFNKDAIRKNLHADGIAYVFLGNELGGRPKDMELFNKGVADYEKMAETSSFKIGLDRVMDGVRKHRVALMCSEHDPLDCHRCLLVGRAISSRGSLVRHVLGTGDTIDQRQVEARLMEMTGLSEVDLFESPAKRLADAYRSRAMKVAFSQKSEII